MKVSHIAADFVEAEMKNKRYVWHHFHFQKARLLLAKSRLLSIRLSLPNLFQEQFRSHIRKLERSSSSRGWCVWPECFGASAEDVEGWQGLKVTTLWATGLGTLPCWSCFESEKLLLRSRGDNDFWDLFPVASWQSSSSHAFATFAWLLSPVSEFSDVIFSVWTQTSTLPTSIFPNQRHENAKLRKICMSRVSNRRPIRAGETVEKNSTISFFAFTQGRKNPFCLNLSWDARNLTRK